MTSRQLRLVRGAAASTAATIIAAVSHTIGGGAAPHPLLIVALSVFLTPVAALLVGRRANIIRLGAAVVLAQTVFHVLFAALGATVSIGHDAANLGDVDTVVYTGAIGRRTPSTSPRRSAGSRCCTARRR